MNWKIHLAHVTAATLAAGALLTSPAMAQTFGLVADNATNTVNVFDIDTNSVVASIPTRRPGFVGDVVITPDQSLGFASDFNVSVWVIDLSTSPPSLATGNNPIPISNAGFDIAVTPDGRFLLVSSGLSATPAHISVVDIASRSEVSTFSTGVNNTAVDVCDDGTSVLTVSFDSSELRRLSLAADGTLTDTGELLSLGLELAPPENVYCAPGSSTGIVVADNSIGSFTIPGLSIIDIRTVSNRGVSAVINPAGDRVFVRTQDPRVPSTGGSVEAFAYDAVTGTLGAMLADSVSFVSFFAAGWIDELGISGGGDALYVPEGDPINAVTVLDAANLTAPPLAAITHPNIVHPTGIFLGAGGVLDVAINISPGSDPNSINLCSNGASTVTIFGNKVDVSLIDPDSLELASASVKTVGKSDRSLCSVEDAGAPDSLFFDNLDPMPDGFDDLTCHFLTTQLTGLDDMATTADVTGVGCDDPNDADGCQPGDAGLFEITGTDSVRIVKDECAS